MIQPTYQGYSIGKWIEEAGGGRYDVLDKLQTTFYTGPVNAAIRAMGLA